MERVDPLVKDQIAHTVGVLVAQQEPRITRNRGAVFNGDVEADIAATNGVNYVVSRAEMPVLAAGTALLPARPDHRESARGELGVSAQCQRPASSSS